MAAIEVANPGLKGVLPKDYNRPALDKAKDVLGRVYEYFLLHYVRNGTVE